MLVIPKDPQSFSFFVGGEDITSKISVRSFKCEVTANTLINTIDVDLIADKVVLEGRLTFTEVNSEALEALLDAIKEELASRG